MIDYADLIDVFSLMYVVCFSSSSTGEGLPATKPKKQTRKRGPSEKKGGLPKSYLMSVFKHFAKTKVSADVYPVLQET